MSYVVFTNVHGDTAVRDLDVLENKVIPRVEDDNPDEEDPLQPYFAIVEDALDMRRDEGPTGESYWQWFRCYFND